MSVYELFFITLGMELLAISVAYYIFLMWEMAGTIFDDEQGYGFNIFDEIEKHENKG